MGKGAFGQTQEEKTANELAALRQSMREENEHVDHKADTRDRAEW